jgi:SAM-dependent methyltransferase
MFTEYSYHSSVSQTFKKHCYDLGKKLMDEFQYEYPLVMDVASNDGCLLDQFRLAGFKRLMGIEPAKNLTTEYLDRQLVAVNEFFTEKLVDCWDYEKVSIITATNVFAHVDDLDDFLKAVYKSLAPDGIFVCEVPYLPDLIQGNQFDTVYHEHLSYFLLKPIQIICDRYGLSIFKVERLPIHGGSLRFYACKDNRTIDGSVYSLLSYEEDQGLYTLEPYQIFSENIGRLRDKFVDSLKYLSRAGKGVVGYGASAKGCSLLNYCNITTDLIQYIVDDTPYKQGKYMPGCNIPITDKFVNPDCIVLLAWNFEKELREKTKWHKGNYIIPIPEVKII